MIALLDGDLIAYRCAASCEKRDKEGNLLALDPLEVAVDRAEKLLQDILQATGSTEYKTFLTGSNNFRKEIDPEYKANRKDKPEPEHLQALREYLVLQHKASITDGYEADDALGIEQTDETIICSLDKDLLQIPGKHYRWAIGTATWTKDAEYLDIGELDGLRSFYISSLVGDKSDNISGIYGLGPVKAGKRINGCTTEKQMFDICRELYADDERFIRNLKLLWILREEGGVYSPEVRGLMDAVQEQV